jgi:hypothetical protein
MKNTEEPKIDPLFMTFFLGGVFWMLVATALSLPCIID